MMRRSRINVRPNVRPGGRGPSCSQEGQAPQGAGAGAGAGPPAAGDTTHAAETEGREPVSEAAPEQPEERSADAAEKNDSQDLTLGKVSPNLGEGQNAETVGGTPIGTAALQRRKRFSALPNLTKPRVPPTPTRAPTSKITKSPIQTVANPPSPADTPVPKHVEQTLEQNGALQGIESPGRLSISVMEEQSTSQEKPSPSSPAAPSISCWDPTPGKMEDKSQSLDPQNTSQETTPSSSKPSPPESFSPHRRGSQSVSSEKAEPSTSYLPLKLAGAVEDRQKLVKAYKLKEMMKLERRKERKQRRGKRPVYDYSGPINRSEMTMRDLLYYLPETNPMTAPVMKEQVQAEKVDSPSCSKPFSEKNKDDEEEEHEEEDNETDEPMLVPRVKVAEDGSLIIDEDSLTVEVLRAKGPSIVEENDPIFERGSTTTYSSFRNHIHTKPWSAKETDMFFLAISMVGMDFSLIGQLLPHRTRAQIRNKFKREERTNAWRVDKAFREKRPFDLEFFSTLLEMVLAADKKRRKKPNTKGLSGAKPSRKRKTKKAAVKEAEGEEALSDAEPDSDAAEGDSETAEKENEDCSNVAESADDTTATRKKRKRTKKGQGEEKGPLAKKQADGRRRKRSKKTQNDESVGIDSEDEATEGQPSAEEDDGSHTVNGTAEESSKSASKPSRTSGRRAKKPNLGRARGPKKAPESEEKAGESSMMDKDEGGDDPDPVHKADNETTAPKRRRAKRGRATVLSSSEEGAEDDPLEDSDIPAVHEQTPNKPTRSGRIPKIPQRPKAKDEEPPPASSFDPKTTTPRGRGKQPGKKPQPNLATNQRDSKPNLVTEDSEEEDQPEEDQPEEDQPEEDQPEEDQPEEDQQEEDQQEEDQQEEGQCRDHAEEEIQGPVLMPLCLSSLEPPPEQPEVSTHLSNATGTALSEQALYSESACEGAQEEGMVLSEQHLDLLVDVIESLSSELVEGLTESEENRDEAASTLLIVRNSDPLSVSAAVPGPEIIHTTESPTLALLEEQEPVSKFELEEASQSQYSFEPPQAGTSEPPATIGSVPVTDLEPISEPLDPAVETTPSREECDQMEEGVTAANARDPQDTASTSDSPLQSVPQGRRSRFPKPRPNLGRATRVPHTPVPQSPAAPSPEISAVLVAADTGSLKTEAEGKDDLEKEMKEQLVTHQDEKDEPDKEKLKLGEAVSAGECQGRLSGSDSPVQSVPPVRRSRFPKPRPNLGRANRAPHTPAPQSPAAPSPADNASVTTPKDSNALTAVEEKLPSSSATPSAVKNDAVTCPEVNTEEGTHTAETVIEQTRRAKVTASTPEYSPQTSLGDMSPTVPPLAMDDQELQSEHVFEPTDQSQYSTDLPQSLTSDCPVTEVSVPATELVPISEPLKLAGETPPLTEEPDSLEIRATTASASTFDAGVASSSFTSPPCIPQVCSEPGLTDPETGGEEPTQGIPVIFDTPQNEQTGVGKVPSLSVDTAGPVPGDEVASPCVEGDANAVVTTENTQGVSWPEDQNEEEPTFILTLFEIPHPEIAEYEPGADPLVPVCAQPFSSLMFVDPQSGAPPTESEPERCEPPPMETEETEPGCSTGTQLLLSDALLPVSDGQKEDTGQDWPALPKINPQTASSENVEETCFHAVTEDIAQSVTVSYEEDHGSQTLVQMAESHDPVAESHDSMEAGMATLSQEERKNPIRSRRSRLQVMPSISKRKPRESGKDAQGILTVEADHSGPAQNSPQHRVQKSDGQQDSAETDAVTSDVLVLGEQSQGIVGHPQEKSVVAESAESSSKGAEPPLGHQGMTSYEPLSVETGETEPECSTVTHLLLSDVLVPVSEGQEEDSEQEWTALAKMSPHTDQGFHTHSTGSEGDPILTAVAKDIMQGLTDSYEEGRDSQPLLPGAESHDSVEGGMTETNERVILSQEKKLQQIGGRRSKLQEKPCISKRKPRQSTKDEQDLLSEESDQPGPAQTSPQTHQHTESDIQQDTEERDATASDVSALVEQSQGIVGHSDLPQEERGVAEGTENSSEGAESPLSHQGITSYEPLSVETGETEPECSTVTHLLLSDVLVPVSEGQEEDSEQEWTALAKMSPHTDQGFHTHSTGSEGDPIFTTVTKDNIQGLTSSHGKRSPKVAESQDIMEAETEGRATLSQKKRKQPIRSRRSKLQVKPCISKRKPRQSTKDEQDLLSEEPDQPGPAQTSPQTHQHTESDIQQDTEERDTTASDVSALVEQSEGIVGHSDLPQEERGVAEGTENSSEGAEPSLSHQSIITSCERLSAETEETEPECSTVTHLFLSDVLVPVSEGQEEDSEQEWTALPKMSPHTDQGCHTHSTGSEGDPILTTVTKDNIQGLTSSHEEDHRSRTLEQVAESQDITEAETEGRATLAVSSSFGTIRSRRSKLQVKPCISKRKPRQSTKDEQDLLSEESDQPGPAQTSPQTHRHTAAESDIQQDTEERDTTASDVSALVEPSQGVVGHSDLPEEERGVTERSESRESKSRGEEQQPGKQSPLTRCGRKPRGFLSFISKKSGTEPTGPPRVDRPLSQRPQVNISRVGRKRTAEGAPTKTSSDSSPLTSPPAKVRATTSSTGPTPEPACSQPSESPQGTAAICVGTSDQTEEEPTRVSQYFFSDAFMEVDEPD